MAAAAFKAWCFTVNNYTADDRAVVESFQDIANYVCYAPEIAPTTGTPHLQGYVDFTRARTLTQVRKLHGLAHWEPRRGSALQARDYCRGDFTTSDGTYKPLNPDFWSAGELEVFGSASDLYAHLLNEIDRRAVTTEHELNLALLGSRYGRSIGSHMHAALVRSIPRTITRRPEQYGIEWHWGPAGSGKTRHVHSRYIVDGAPSPYPWDGRTFTGYVGELVVLGDEFRLGELVRERGGATGLLNLANDLTSRGHALYVGSTPLQNHTTCLTSPDSPGTGWDYRDGPSAQLFRRISLAFEWTGPGTFRCWFNPIYAGGLPVRSTNADWHEFIVHPSKYPLVNSLTLKQLYQQHAASPLWAPSQLPQEPPLDAPPEHADALAHAF